VSAGSHGTTLSGAPKASQHPPSLKAGKRKANELVSSGGSSQPANRRQGPGVGCAPLPAFISVTGEQAALGSRQIGPPEDGVTYAATLGGPVTRSQPSGSLKPTAMNSDMSEPAVSSETANRHVSSDISGPLSDMPDGATLNAQVANSCLPAGERPNKTPIFISGVRDTRAFLAWLRASCSGGLTAQLKSEKLMVVLSTADGFRAAVRALRSLDWREGVRFHKFTLPEDRCVWLLVKNLGRGMPESGVRQELESLNIRVQGVTQLRSGRRDQDLAKDRPPTPHFIVSVARGPEVSKVRCLTEHSGLRVSVESYVAQKDPLQCKS